mgnify:CR=1 FL=1
MERNDANAKGFLIRCSPGCHFFRLFEEVPDDRGGKPCKVARWSSEPMTAQHFGTAKEADLIRDAWGLPCAAGLGIVPASDPFGVASYRTFQDGRRVS